MQIIQPNLSSVLHLRFHVRNNGLPSTDQETVFSFMCSTSIKSLTRIEISVLFQYTSVSQCHFSVISRPSVPVNPVKLSKTFWQLFWDRQGRHGSSRISPLKFLISKFSVNIWLSQERVCRLSPCLWVLISVCLRMSGNMFHGDGRTAQLLKTEVRQTCLRSRKFVQGGGSRFHMSQRRSQAQGPSRRHLGLANSCEIARIPTPDKPRDKPLWPTALRLWSRDHHL